MALFNSLTFDGVNSLDSGVYITGEAVYNAPERQVNMVTVPGRNGTLALDQGRFENIEVTYPAGCFADDQTAFAEKVRNLRNEFASRVSYKRLSDTYHPDEYRLGVYKSGLEISPVRYNSAGQFDITFDCKPQRFLVSGETALVFTANGEIENPTLFASKPLLVVTGVGTINIGAYVLTVESGGSSSQVINIDCETQEAWEVIAGAKLSRNDLIQNAGESFPELAAGTNNIILGTGITRLEITPRWWRI